MDQDKVNPFVGNTETPTGGAPVSDASGSNAPASASSSSAATPTQSVPVNPYAPAGAPYAPGSNTPAPDYATPYAGGTYASPSVSSMSSDSPAVPNTGSSAYTSFSPAPSQNQDIYMPSDSPEKPKLFTKKFIIFAIIGLVLIAGAVVAGVLIQNNRKKGTNISKSTEDVSYLNSYMNYILYGTDSNAKIQDITNNAQPIFIEKALGNNKNINIDAAKIMIDKWQTFLSKYDTSRSEAIKNFVKNNQSNIDFFKAYTETQPLTEKDIVEDYFAGNTERKYFEQKYSSFYEISNLANKYIEEQINYALAVFEKIKIYQNHDCMIDQNFNADCMGSKILSDQEKDTIVESMNFYHAAAETYNDIVGQISNDSWLVYNVVSNIGEWEKS